MNDWAKKELDLLRQHYPTMPNRDLANMLGRSPCSIRTKAVKEGIRKQIASNNPYTPEKERLLVELYPNMRNVEIAKILGVTEPSVIGKGFKLGLRKTTEFLRSCSEKGFYKKGKAPANKGKKMPKKTYDLCKATMFQKGATPPNRKPVGYERTCKKDGYIYVKTGEGMHQFKLKHRVIYEQHFGKIPKGCNVEFTDRDRRNFDPSNLVLRTRKQNMEINTYHQYPKEISNTIQLMGVMTRQINKHKKRLQNEK